MTEGAAAREDFYLPDEVEARLKVALAREHSGPAFSGDHVLQGFNPDPALAAQATRAAVLIGIVARASGVTLLLTQRSENLRRHSGQVAFPGGKLDLGEDAAEAALREAEEEIGLSQSRIRLLGSIEPYVTTTGFHITPVLAIVDPDYTLTLNPVEVDSAFEVPLSALMRPECYLIKSREWNGALRYYYEIDYPHRQIWGVTAGIIRRLYERIRD